MGTHTKRWFTSTANGRRGGRPPANPAPANPTPANAAPVNNVGSESEPNNNGDDGNDPPAQEEPVLGFELEPDNNGDYGNDPPAQEEPVFESDQTPAPRLVKEGSPIESSDPPAVLELFPIEYVEPHRFEGSFIVKGKEDTLATLNPIPGDSVYGEKRVSFYDRVSGAMVEYRVWNPFRSKLAAGMMAGIENTRIKPGSKVLYLGAAYGVTASHVSDIVGPEGLVYAVEASPRRGQRLAEIAENRPNITPIVADARYPSTYRMRVQVDTIISDIADPHQAQIIAHNAMMLLKTGGYCVTTIMPNRIDRTAAPEAVFAKEIEKLKGEEFNLCERISLEPYERDQVMVVVQYQPSAKP